MMAFLRTRLGKSVIWQKFSETESPTLRVEVNLRRHSKVTGF